MLGISAGRSEPLAQPSPDWHKSCFTSLVQASYCPKRGGNERGGGKGRPESRGDGKRLPLHRVAKPQFNGDIVMSLIGITSGAAHSVLQSATFQNHSPKKATGLVSESDAGGIGLLPVGAGQNLLSGAIQALQQTLGTSAVAGTTSTAVNGVTGVAATGTGTAGGTSAITSGATAGAGQAVSSFLHTLFQTLQQDVSASAQTATASASSAGATAASSAATAASGSASQYTGSLESSLQTLIQQLGSSGATTPATANLNASFANLVNSVDASGTGTGTGSATGSASGASTATAATGTSSTGTATASTAQLQSFLTNFLQQLQTPGLHSPSLLGSNVNANV
jgi:hypothetical protein